MSTEKKATTRAERLSSNNEQREPLFPDENEGTASQQQEQAEQQQEEANEGLSSDPGTLDFNSPDYAAAFEKAEGSQGTEITADFLKLDELVPKAANNFMFLGHSTFPDNVTGESKPCVKLKSKAQQTFICGATMVVRACNDLKPGAFIRIILNSKDKIKGKNGSYYDVSVYQL